MARRLMLSLVSKWSLGWVLCAGLFLPQLAQAEAPWAALAPSLAPPQALLLPVREAVREKSSPRRGLLIAGSILLATSYSVSLITGATFSALSGACGNQGSALACGQSLPAEFWTQMIPFAGPFASAILTQSRAGFSGEAAQDAALWSVPMTLLIGPAQLAGLAMIVAAHPRPPKGKPQLGGTNVSMGPYATHSAAGLFVAGSF